MAASPTKPKKAKEAVTADPGELTKVEREPDQPESAQRAASKSEPHEPDKKKTGWIEVVLIDEADKPVPGESVLIKLPDGKIHSGSLDDQGFIRVDGFDPGTCEICFPNLDKDAWEPR